MELIKSNELWAAILGGLLSLAGSFLSLVWQKNSSKKDQKNNYISFYYDNFKIIQYNVSQILYVYNSQNYVSYRYLSVIETITSLVERHLDGFLFIDNKRDEIRKFFFDTLFFCAIIRQAEKVRSELQLQIKSEADESVSKDLRLKLEEEKNHINRILHDFQMDLNSTNELFNMIVKE
jgi:hypothetical protein